MFDDGWLADLIAFAWWKHDADKANEPKAAPVIDVPKDQKVRKAWDAVVGEWDEHE
jgi:hypothetical protein